MTREEAAGCAQKAANVTQQRYYAWTFDGKSYRVGAHLPVVRGVLSYMLFTPQEAPTAKDKGVQRRGIARHYC